MSKLKVLVITPDTSAVSFYRSKNPHEFIQQHYSEFCEVDICPLEELPVNEEFDYEYHIIHFPCVSILTDGLWKKLSQEQGKGVKLICDIDDYWVIPKHNPAYPFFMNDNNYLRIVDCIKKCDGVTTTTKIFGKELLKYNKNVCVLPNIIETPHRHSLDHQRHSLDSRLKIGILCGSSHLKDLQLFGDMVKQLKPYQDKIKWVLCGFDVRGNNQPELSIWNDYEKIMTDNYSILDEEYKQHLLNFNTEPFPTEGKQPYKRCWSKSVDEYHTLFDEIDILLCPLISDKFNNMKSELKAIEAGTHNKVLICSEVGIYKDLFKHKENCLMVNRYRNDVEWVKNIKYLLLNPTEVDRLRKNLSDTIEINYDMDLVSYERIKFYTEIKNK